jgi:hypothetical protein
MHNYYKFPIKKYDLFYKILKIINISKTSGLSFCGSHSIGYFAIINEQPTCGSGINTLLRSPLQ